jgi:sugar phosphate isomerase/epimerase
MLYGGHVKSPADIEFLQQNNFDFGEVILSDGDSRRFWTDSKIYNTFDSGFFLLAHGPREGAPNDLKSLWKKYYPALQETVDVAVHMGIGFITIHLWTDPRFVWGHVRAEKHEILRQIVAYGNSNHVSIGLENLSENALDLKAVLDAVPGLGITLDVGHGQLLAETNTAFDIIGRLADSIKHVHLHDNRGGQGVLDDLHLPIGEGIVEFPRILKALVSKGYNGTLCFELKNEDLNASSAKVRSVIERMNQLGCD